MISPWSFDDKVLVQSVSKVYDGVGSVQTWTDGETLYACIVQKSKNQYTEVHLEFDQRFSQTVTYRLLVRGRKSFDYANTRFIWQSLEGSRILKPTESVRWPGNRHHFYTSILVEDITDMEPLPT